MEARHPYWATTAEVADLLGVTQHRVRQLVDRGFLPAVQLDGRWFYRRHQIEVVANAREARKLRGTLSTTCCRATISRPIGRPLTVNG